MTIKVMCFRVLVGQYQGLELAANNGFHLTVFPLRSKRQVNPGVWQTGPALLPSV